ncbi:clarin-1 [Eucyclogobius newberryi]|uniref:clarin-1 n=1 Tax=Eucyclogobius newberryi TaxID=166745 RepID=UPI003B5B1871
MSSRQKRLLFAAAGALSFGCALAAAVATGLPLWVDAAVLCRTGAELVNATGAELQQFIGAVSYGLFTGSRVKQCGLGGRPQRFYFFPELLTQIPAGLHVTVLVLCSSVVLFSSLCSGIFFYNAFGRPYQTLLGPTGLYLWTGLSGGCSLLVLVLFSCEVKIRRVSERIANFNESTFVFQTHSERYERSYWLFLLVFFVQALDVLLIRLSGIQFPFHQEKPTDAQTGASDLMY